MDIDFSKEYAPVFQSNARYVSIMGGRGRGGSYFAVTYAAYRLSLPRYERVYFMRAVYSDIKDSLFSDFKDWAENTGNDQYFEIGKTIQTPILHKGTGNQIICKGFRKSDNTREAKLKSLSNITCVIIEEANEITEEDFDKLDDSLRTLLSDNLQIIFVLNPPNKDHWFIKRFYDLEDAEIFNDSGEKVEGYYEAIAKPLDNFLSIQTDYTHNLRNLNESTIKKYRDFYKEKNPEYYYTVILGYISEGIVGKIYRGWKTIKEMPREYDRIIAIDPGFDAELGAVEIEIKDQNVYVQELVYESELTTPKLIEYLEAGGVERGKDVIYVDAAQPGLVAELVDAGFLAFPAKKGVNSVEDGIKYIRGLNVHITGRSENIWDEYRLYRINPKTGKIVKENDHLMDAIRYGIFTYVFGDIAEESSSQTPARKRKDRLNRRKKKRRSI